jgi:DNA-binding NarL/FixJ family response regulator
VRVLLVEESAALTSRLLERLKEVPKLEVVGSARTVTGATRAIATQVPDLVITDTEMAGGSGVALLHVMKAHRTLEGSGPHVLVWTGCRDPRRRAMAEALGAEAHFDKAREVDLLVDYCRQAAVRHG